MKVDINALNILLDKKVNKNDMGNTLDRVDHLYTMIQSMSLIQNEMAKNNSNKTDPVNKKL